MASMTMERTLMGRQPDENGAAALVAEIRKLVKVARAATDRQVNAVLVITNFGVGRRIVQHDQKGNERARYGKGVRKSLPEAPTTELGRWFSVQSLELMRRFFLECRDQLSMSQTVSATSEDEHDGLPIELTSAGNIAAAADAFKLSWSHYVFPIGSDDANERSFYEVEAAHEGWSLAESRRQFDVSLYERLALSRDKVGARTLAENGHVVNWAGGPAEGPIRTRVPRSCVARLSWERALPLLLQYGVGDNLVRAAVSALSRRNRMN